MSETDTYQFEMCMEPGCLAEATFITEVDWHLVCYCDVHGAAHGLERGIPLAKVAKELGDRAAETARILDGGLS